MAEHKELYFTPATVLREKILYRELSSVELVEAILRRIEEKDDKVHAMVTVDTDSVMRDARAADEALAKGDIAGPLHGIPVTVKDLFPTKGLRTTYGSKFMEDFVPDFDDIATGRLRAAGAIILGKTNTPAYGHKDMCDNLIMEATRNPWKLDRTSGASSGGAGAAAAAGFGPLALGSDGAGSIRIPAALCGVYGMKPSFGRVPYWPNTDYWGTRSHIGPMTRTVRDAALMLSVMAGPDPRDPQSIDATQENYLDHCHGSLKGLKIAWSSDFGYAPIDTEIREQTARAVKIFQELGATVVEANPQWDDPRDWHAVIYRAGIAVRHGPKMDEKPEWIDESLEYLIREGRQISAETVLKAQSARSTFYNQAQDFMKDYDLLICPAMPIGAWEYDGQPGQAEGKEIPKRGGGRWPLMFPFNVLGWPAASAPCGFTSEGLPIGLQLIAPWHRDDLCIKASAAFEQAQPWHEHVPAL
jgi:Asp-tRNA(Asn)/Glu-tRNA(Gln) amidotransferase A subunit family amidase